MPEMADERITKDFIRVERTVEGVQFFVCSVSWDGPHTPVMNWSWVTRIGGSVTDEQMAAEVTRILDDRKHFTRCGECRELNPLGWMHDERICQSCAEQNHQVIH